MMTNKRDIFAELTEGFEALKSDREDKLMLRTFKVERKPAPGLQAARPPRSDFLSRKEFGLALFFLEIQSLPSEATPVFEKKVPNSQPPSQPSPKGGKGQKQTARLWYGSFPKGGGRYTLNPLLVLAPSPFGGRLGWGLAVWHLAVWHLAVRLVMGKVKMRIADIDRNSSL